MMVDGVGVQAGPLSWREAPIRRGSRTLVATAVGAAVTFLAVGHTAASAAYSSSPAAKVDGATIVLVWLMAPTVWAMGRTALVAVLPDAGPHPGRHRVIATVVALVVAAAAGLAGDFARGTNTGAYLGIWRTMATYAMATFAAYPALAAMWVAGNRARAVSASTDDPAGPVIAELAVVRSTVVTAVSAVGAVVTVGVFAAGAQRQAWAAYSTDLASYPPAYVVVMGLAVTLFLAANAVPAWSRWRAAALREVDLRLPVIAPPGPGWRNRLEDRDAYSALLGLSQTAGNLLTSSVVVLGPLLSAAVSLFLPGTK